MNKQPEEPRSLLRRLLRQADQVGTQSLHPTQAAPPPSPPTVTAPTSNLQTSPVRPPAPPVAPAPAPVLPVPPKSPIPKPVPSARAPGSPAERLEAETALEELRRKTAQVATEFADGKINRAQFSSMYAYY